MHLRQDLGYPELCVHYDEKQVTLSQVVALMRAAGGPGGLTPILPVAWIDLLAPLAAPLVAAAIGALAARRAALKLLQALP